MENQSTGQNNLKKKDKNFSFQTSEAIVFGVCAFVRKYIVVPIYKNGIIKISFIYAWITLRTNYCILLYLVDLVTITNTLLRCYFLTPLLAFLFPFIHSFVEQVCLAPPSYASTDFYASKQESASFFCKSLVNILGFVGRTVSVATPQSCLCIT